MHTIPVRLHGSRDRSYDIVVEAGILRRLPQSLAAWSDIRGIFLITDATVNRLYGRQLADACRKIGLATLVLDVPPGERSKNPELVLELQTELLRHGVQRSSLIVALGGGVIGDLAGFVAATVLRGVSFVQVPTTLLAQVDSSVGGKVGIDHPAGKNLIGAFHQPRAVYIDPLVLKSLPERQFRNGLAEVVKIATALDGQFFRYLTRHARSLTRTNSKLMETVVVRSAGLKAAVVEKDEYEGSLRKSLNLGHTIGHAIEAASNFRISHGEAVSIGMVVEAEIAVRLGLMERADKTVLERSLKALKLPTRVPRIGNRRVFFDALSVDKKSVGGKTKFVLPAGIGCSAIGVDVPLTLIEAIMDFR